MASPAAASAPTDEAQPAEPSSEPARAAEVVALARRLHHQHPSVPFDTILAVVAQEHAALESSRVQGFRLILTERAVRRRLAPRLDEHRAVAGHLVDEVG